MRFISVFLASLLLASSAIFDDHYKSFVNPPKEARPGVYWYFMDGNRSRESITADLESMSREGIGYVVFLEVNLGVPRGNVDFMSDEWLDIFRYTIDECKRLDIQMILGIGPGWTGSGGPWVRPEESMRHLMSSSVNVKGDGSLQHLTLPKPSPHSPYFGTGGFSKAMMDDWTNYYDDVAVLAFPKGRDTGMISDIDEKAHFIRAPYSSVPGVKQYLDSPDKADASLDDSAVPAGNVIDLTGQMSPDGRLDWQVPDGEWVVLRMGARNNGAVTRPAPEPGLGMECDKLSVTYTRNHLAEYTDKLFEIAGESRDTFGGIKFLHMDSWEMGAQNWTDDLRQEFIRRRGYDPLPYFPVFAGYVIGSSQTSERFLWDLRKTIQELVIEEHAGTVKEYAHKHGTKLSIEPYDMNPVADLELAVEADIPMAEFWCKGFGYNTSFAPVEATSAAHIIGQNVVPAESFTSYLDGFTQHPGSLKGQTDWAFAGGINRLVFHTFQHQTLPENVKPGMTMGPHGVQWNRNQTWWHLSHAYHTYVARCQYMLQQGRTVADILYLTPESIPHVFRAPVTALNGAESEMPDRKGFNFDACPPSRIKSATVKKGRIIFPGGASYAVMELPQYGTMTPELLKIIYRLVRKGAVVVGRPPVCSPSLSDYPDCDMQVRLLSAKIWGEGNEHVRKVGKGKVYLAEGAADNLYQDYEHTVSILKKIGLTAPDFESEGDNVRYTHHILDGSEFYFVSNRTSEGIDVRCKFRTDKRHAELWDPLTGERYSLELDRNGDVMETDLGFAPDQSFFVMLDNHPESPVLPRYYTDKQLVTSIETPYKVSFDGHVTTMYEQLADWTQSDKDEIRYFSGSAIYENSFDLKTIADGSRYYLDLGEVHDIASISLNGHDCGILWTCPWVLDITDSLVEGNNVLRIEIVNQWHNRLLGDERFPYDGPANGKWPDWISSGAERTSGRVAFAVNGNSQHNVGLMPSGLIGPVKLYVDTR